MRNISQFRHREVRWEGLIMISNKTILLSEEKKWDAVVQILLCANQEYIFALNSERLPLIRYTLIIFTVYIWKNRHKFWVRIEIDLKFIHTILYQNEFWHAHDCLIFHIYWEERLIIYMHDYPTGVYTRTTVFILLF